MCRDGTDLTRSPYNFRHAIKSALEQFEDRVDDPEAMLGVEREKIETSPSAWLSLPEPSQGQRVRRTDSRGFGRRKAALASSSLLRVSRSTSVVSSLLPPSLYRPVEPLVELHRICQQFIDVSHGFLQLFLGGFLERQPIHKNRWPSPI